MYDYYPINPSSSQRAQNLKTRRRVAPCACQLPPDVASQPCSAVNATIPGTKLSPLWQTFWAVARPSNIFTNRIIPWIKDWTSHHDEKEMKCDTFLYKISIAIIVLKFEAQLHKFDHFDRLTINLALHVTDQSPYLAAPSCSCASRKWLLINFSPSQLVSYNIVPKHVHNVLYISKTCAVPSSNYSN